MTPQNPAQHARVAADALERLVRDVQTGHAAWAHPHTVRQAVDDLTRITTAASTALLQLAAAHSQHTQPGPRTTQSVTALHQAGHYTTTAATQLRTARHTMN
ncbi:hypothetical protein ACIA8E_38175 [Streptomyces sp. NPDC051664]|uniref:hypothetical protein n=1 Tax=Streptomyces sp. NPDC051664 TaxID=3365668 RepID=UPI0037AB655B